MLQFGKKAGGVLGCIRLRRWSCPSAHHCWDHIWSTESHFGLPVQERPGRKGRPRELLLLRGIPYMSANPWWEVQRGRSQDERQCTNWSAGGPIWPAGSTSMLGRCQSAGIGMREAVIHPRDLQKPPGCGAEHWVALLEQSGTWWPPAACDPVSVTTQCRDWPSSVYTSLDVVLSQCVTLTRLWRKMFNDISLDSLSPCW